MSSVHAFEITRGHTEIFHTKFVDPQGRLPPSPFSGGRGIEEEAEEFGAGV